MKKPNTHLAEEFVVAGVYLWNSGMLMVKASRYSEELKKTETTTLSKEMR